MQDIYTVTVYSANGSEDYMCDTIDEAISFADGMRDDPMVDMVCVFDYDARNDVTDVPVYAVQF